MAQRDEAVKYAKSLVEEGAPAVRVMKETHQPETGDYMTLTIFEHGATETKTKNKKLDEGASSTPCFKPDDLYSHHARATMARILADWLARWKLTPTEFIHTAAGAGEIRGHRDHLSARDPEGRGSPGIGVRILGGADRQASERSLHDCDPSRLQGRAARPFPDAGGWTIRSPGGAPGSESRGRYALNGALAKYLRTAAPNWDAKLQSLLGLMAELPAEGPGRALLLNAIDVAGRGNADRLRRLWRISSARTPTSAMR